METFNYRLIKQLRLERQWSARQMAVEYFHRHHQPITAVTIWNYERGRFSPPAQKLPMLAELFGKKVAEFYLP